MEDDRTDEAEPVEEKTTRWEEVDQVLEKGDGSLRALIKVGGLTR